MKKKLLIFVIICLLSPYAFADDFATYYENGQNYLKSSQYTKAIGDFKKALRINYLDNSARIGIINSYLARGAYYANNENDYNKAANDFRSALFYLKYYAEEKDVNAASAEIQTTIENLNQCMTSQGQSKADNERYNRATVLRKEGNLSAAGYEFAQLLNSTNKNIQKNAYLQLGDILSVLDNSKKAAIYYKKAVALDSENISTRLKYARLLDKLKQDDLAVQEYNYILSKGSDNQEVLYAIEKIYTKKIQQDPKNAELNANLGAILQKENKLDEAIKYYKLAEELNPSSVTTRLNIGTLYQQKKDYTSALSAYNSVLALYPDNLQANLYRAQVLAESGEKEEALKAYNKVLELEPTSVIAKKQMLEIMKGTKTPQEMMQTFVNDSGVDKSSIQALYEYAKSLHNDKNFDSAIACYEEVLKYDSSNPELYTNLAVVYLQKQNLQKAEEYAFAGKTKFPNSTELKNVYKEVEQAKSDKTYNDANKYFVNSDYQKALDIYLTINPKSKDVLIAIAVCYKGLNNIDKAIEYYKQAFAIDNNNSEIAYYIGVLYAEKENWTSSKIYLQKALKLNSNNENAKDLLSTVIEQNNVLLIDKVINLYNKKEYDNALKLLSQILTEDNKNAYAYYYRGLIYDAQEKPNMAIPEYKKAITNNSELYISDYLIATAYDSLGQYSNAYTHYKKFVSSSSPEDEYKKYARVRLNDLKNYDNPTR